MFCKRFLLLAVVCALPLSATTTPKADDKPSNSEKKESQNKKEATNKVNDKRCALFQAFEHALITNKDILAMEYEIRAGHEGYISVRSAMFPTMAANAGYNARYGEAWTPDVPEGDPGKRGSSKSREKEYGITTKLNLFHGGADLAAIKEVDLQIRARWSKYEATKQKVLREVAAYYFEIYAKMQELLHIKALLESRHESLKVAQEMYKTGGAKYLDVAQASASCAEVEAKLAKAESDYQSLRAKFTEISGFVLPIKLDAPKQLFNTSMTVKQGIDLAMRRNPNIIAAADSLAAAREAAKKPVAKSLPTVDFQYSYGYHLTKADQANNHNNNSRDHAFRVVAAIPIYDAGVGRSEKRQAQELVSKAAVENEKAIEETRTEITSTWAALVSAQRNIESAKAAVEARELALKVTEEEYNAGLKIVNDVLKAQQELFEAKFLAIQAEKEYFVGQCSAIALIGGMNPHNLKLKVDQHSENSLQAHFAETKMRVL
ncbi:MAG: TolC family protein [Holosporales bacterium]|jgi:outer membrane protein TolC|nr:TolC family protein [Holosporales bacterium]